MIYPYLYRKDCINITNGYILDHDDTSINDDDHNNDNDKDKEDENYWKYGRLGQFNRKHYISIVIKEKAYLTVNGYIRNKINYKLLSNSIPNEIIKLLFNIYFDDENELNKLLPSPPPIQQDRMMCKGGPACCIGDHLNMT